MTTRARISVAVACLVVALAPARAGANDPSDAQLSNLSRVVPPRTVGDVTGVLNEYKPDPGRAAAAKAAADQPPPTGQSDAELAEFYLRRALAANQVGRPVQQLADARQAVAYAEKAGVERASSSSS